MLAGWPGRVPSRGPTAGKIRLNCFSNSLPGAISRSWGSQLTMASMLVCRLHKLGPRKARILETSMKLGPG